MGDVHRLITIVKTFNIRHTFSFIDGSDRYIIHMYTVIHKHSPVMFYLSNLFDKNTVATMHVHEIAINTITGFSILAHSHPCISSPLRGSISSSGASVSVFFSIIIPPTVTCMECRSYFLMR